MSGWIQTFTGRQFWPLNPQACDVCLLDIAHHLACTNRFGGATCEPYSVAEHSVRVMRYVADMGGSDDQQRWALFHDAGEAYTADIHRPIKRNIMVDCAGDGACIPFVECERAILAAIREALRLPELFPREMEAIKLADNVIMATEKRDLMAKQPADWEPLPPPLIDPIRPWGWLRARNEFLREAAILKISDESVRGMRFGGGH